LAGISRWLHQHLGRRWEELPSRYKLVFATSTAFVLCNMDKVNISVAIIPMAQDFGWSPTMAGIVQSSFFFGYMFAQIPGGYVISKMGGRRILPAGVGLWSAATAAVPLMAGTVPGLFMSRAAVGLGESVAPSSATDMVARVISKEERSRAMSFIFGGLPLGSLLGLLVAPHLIENFGWATVFYAFGGLGFLWAVWFEYIQSRIAITDPETAAKLSGVARTSSAAVGSAAAAAEDEEAVPWRGFLRNRPVQALAYTHFCNNWFHYTMMAWLPTYFVDTMNLNITQAAQLSLLPPIASIAVSGAAGTVADALIARGMPVAHVRKLAQCTAFLGPSLCLLGAALTDDSTATVGFITAALGLASFSLAGLYCNHADISPRYAPVLLGLTNTSGAIPGIIGVTISGAIYDQTGSWPLALFAPSIFFFLTGSAVFTAFGRSELQDFSNTQPFGFEAPVQKAVQKLPLKQAQAAANSIQAAAGSVRSKVQPLAEAAATRVTKVGSKLSRWLKRKEL
jgi:ACS family sodium-dependent inorganic phosphate cotransporter